MIVIPELHVGRGAVFGPVTVFPVWTGAPMVAGLVSGRSASVEVKEQEPEPVVGELLLTNSSDAPALLVEGELLEGGWQHRVLQHDVVIAAGRTLLASVACVEHGRWHGEERHVRQARRSSPRIRAALAEPETVRQSAVWARVADYDASFGASPTASYLDHMDRFGEAAAQIDSAVVDRIRQLTPLPGQMGVIVGLAGQPVALELYPSTDALEEFLTELVMSFFLDATSQTVSTEIVPSRRARRFADRLQGLTLDPEVGIDAGMATPVRVENDHVMARGSVVADRWAHLSVFNRHHQVLATV